MTYSEYLMYGEEEVKPESSSNFLGLVEKAPEAPDPVDDLPFDCDPEDPEDLDEDFEGDLEDKFMQLLEDGDIEDDRTELERKIDNKEDLLPSELREYWGSLFYEYSNEAKYELDKLLNMNPKNFDSYTAFSSCLGDRYYLLCGMIKAYQMISGCSYEISEYLTDQLFRIKRLIDDLYFENLEKKINEL